MIDISRISAAVHAEGLDHWLFCNFHHRDALSDSVLGIPRETTNSRFWFYLVPAKGEPLRIVHAIEAGILAALPGRLETYSSRSGLEAILRRFAGAKVGVHYSDTVSAVSTLDLGTARLLEGAGLRLYPGDGLIQRLHGLLDAAGIASHEEAGRNLYRIVELVWARVAEAYRRGLFPTELEVQGWILAYFEEMGMETDHPPIVAAGRGAGDPHYEPGPGKNKAFALGEVIQLDLWAKLKQAGSIYADISWLGVFGPEPPEAARKPFAALIAARDEAVAYIAAGLARGEAPQGAEVDALVRTRLEEAGFGAFLKHRTGHGIDVECHGSGANLDSVEFPDRRRLVEGACFSIEPGLYFGDFGLRTEIDVYISAGKAVVSGGSPQREFLRCEAS